MGPFTGAVLAVKNTDANGVKPDSNPNCGEITRRTPAKSRTDFPLQFYRFHIHSCNKFWNLLSRRVYE